ncbi:thioesterase family protein [Bowmanella sp. JS7-9]|uniref:Medium/long-chain acyl-CoA thioesterase YigI n=1 Tax=Pseudobowmanella zhangzhouensis TaxID=1537679 RepID=A0ABW1XPV5_9ALTE|nr:thioesterase family protein [Bowmanella sp. JS7-9]
MQQTDTINEAITQIFRDMPFNQLLGLVFVRYDNEQVEIHMPANQQLTGNPMLGILHGGVTASILDTAGGLMAVLEAVRHMPDVAIDELRQRLRKVGTIDMRVDYLRPGSGDTFIATAHVIRKGSRVAVCRMELHNDQGTHIAVGTGTYMIS